MNAEQTTIRIPVDEVVLEGELVVPAGSKGVVIFAHGSGSGRHSPRNKFVAQQLQKQGQATLLVDLLSEEEDSVYETRFDIALLTRRLDAVTRWTAQNDTTKDKAVGYFGASTGAAAALLATQNSVIKAVVSRGGRVDLASQVVESLQVPTLFIVGEKDPEVLQANTAFYNKTPAKKKLAVIPEATHLFEEPSTLEQVATLAAAWFQEHLM